MSLRSTSWQWRSWSRLAVLVGLALPVLAWCTASLVSEDVLFSPHGTLGKYTFEATVPLAQPGASVRANAYSDVQRRRGGPPNRPNRTANAEPAARRPGPLRAKPLLIDQPLAESLGDPGYVSQVGGVAFDQVAKPSAELETARLRASYDYALPDGRRLVLYIDDQPCFTRDLPDWQLAPIVHYADSPYSAVVSLFGKLEVELPPQQLAEIAYVVAFHPAFEETLIGLRLFQSDFMLLDNSLTGDLPRFRGRYLLGPEEAAPNPAAWQPAADSLSQILARRKFTSYVICDQAEPVLFRVQPPPRGSKEPPTLELTGGIQYHFWTAGPRVQIERGNTIVDTFTVVPVPELTDPVYRSQVLLQQANPQVYAATTNTLRYAALFRYLKVRDAEAWRKFVDEIDYKIPPQRYAAPTPVVIFKRPEDRGEP